MIRIIHLHHCSPCWGSLGAYAVCACASPVSSPNLHLNGRLGSNRIPGRRCLLERLAESRGKWWWCWWCLGDDGFGVAGGGGGCGEGYRKMTDLVWVVASTSERELPSNQLQETAVWEDNYKYFCQRHHVAIDALG